MLTLDNAFKFALTAVLLSAVWVEPTFRITDRFIGGTWERLLGGDNLRTIDPKTGKFSNVGVLLHMVVTLLALQFVVRPFVSTAVNASEEFYDAVST